MGLLSFTVVMARFSFYVVTTGRIPGVYADYAAARRQTDGVAAAPRGFHSRTAAERYARQHVPVERDTTEIEAIRKSCGCCWYCGVQLTSVASSRGRGQLDHQKPRCQGGGSSVDNIVLACATCNVERKSGKDLEQFREWWRQSGLHVDPGVPVVFFGELDVAERHRILDARGTPCTIHALQAGRQ